MGVLAASGMIGQEGPSASQLNESVSDSTSDTADSGESESSAATEPEAPKESFVPFSAIEPRKPGSRRSRAEAQVQEQISQAKQEWQKERDQDRQLLIAQKEQLARLMGQMETMQRMPAPQAAPTGPAEPDPQELLEKAERAIQEGRFDEYHKLNHKAAVIQARRESRDEFQKEIAQLRQQMPAPVNPMIQMLMVQHKHVAMSGSRGEQAVMLKDAELDLYGVPKSPERLRKAFELADQMLAGQRAPSAPAYGQDIAAALAGLPTGRSAGGPSAAEEPGYKMTGADKEVAQAMRMTDQEFVKWKFPDRWMKR